MEKEWFCERIREQQTSMYRYALGVLRNSADAEDAVGEAILRAYEKKEQLRDSLRFKSWVMSILANVTKTMLTKRGKVEFLGDMSPYEGSTKGEKRELWEFVMGLPQEFRDVVILYYYDGFLIKEIAQILKVSEGTVKSRLNRAKKKLRMAWEECR